MICKRVIIGSEDYLIRWHIIPRNPWFNIYLHKFVGSDDDRAVHDHPWWSLSFLLRGDLQEVTCDDEYSFNIRNIRRFVPYLRRPTARHRIVVPGTPAWTLFFTGPRVREWGFWPNSKEFIHWAVWESNYGRKR